MARITPEHLAQLRTDGYVVVHDFMPDGDGAEDHANPRRSLPTRDEMVSEPEKWASVHRTRDSVAELQFRGNALNHMSTHPELIAFSRAALGHDHVFLTQAICWAKYAGRTDFEQSLHLDWHDNSLVMPRSDGAYGQLHMRATPGRARGARQGPFFGVVFERHP